MKKIRLVIIDDSAVVRLLLKKGLSRYEDIEVVGMAPDVFTGRDMIVQLQPDVVTLDIEMPKMNGLEFLKRLMPQYPVPVIMVSSLTEWNARITLEALEAGAVDYVQKPAPSDGGGFEAMLEELAGKIRTAEGTDLSRFLHRDTAGPGGEKRPCAPVHPSPALTDTAGIIGVGASTGGTVAITALLQSLPRELPGIVIVQHMPAGFTASFAQRLNQITPFEVKEAETGDEVLPGRVLIAPGGFHMNVNPVGGGWKVRCYRDGKVNGHCPSVDVLFESLARSAGKKAVGIVLTGMGRDGAWGLKAIRDAGGRTLAQDRATSAVFGMPAEAFACGGAERLLPLEEIPAVLTHLLRKGRRSSAGAGPG